LDVELLPQVDIFGLMIFDWRSGVLERLDMRLLFFQEFGNFFIELSPVDPITHDHKASSDC
jgi:hypothetical protein